MNVSGNKGHIFKGGMLRKQQEQTGSKENISSRNVALKTLGREDSDGLERMRR